MSPATRPPRWSRLLTALLLRGETRDIVVGDLEERFHRRLESESPAAARRWYARQTLASIASVWAEVLRSIVRGRGVAGPFLRGSEWMRTARTMARHPGYASSVVLTLGLGLGATTAVFSVVDGVLLRPLALERPDELVAVWMTQDGESTNLSGANGLDLRDEVAAFDGLYLFTQGSVVLEEGAGGRLRPVESVAATEGVLDVLGARPHLGRDLRDDDTAAGAPPVVLLSYGLWRDAFGSDGSWVGRTTLVDGRPTEIVGVLPEGFEVPMAPDARVVTPLTRTETFMARDLIWVGGVARLGAGVDVARARAETESVWEGLRSAYPDMILDQGVTVIPLQSYLVEDVRGALLVLLAATGLLLAMACVSVGGLLLARGRSRRSELALRSSMGAGRGRVVSELLLEGAVLTGGATAVGIVVAHGLLFGMRRLGPANLPRLAEVGLDGRVLMWTALGAVLVGLVTSGLPAVRATREAPASSLVRSGRGAISERGARRSRFATVSVQVALATVLLATAGLLGRSFLSLVRVHPGFDVDDIVLARVSLPATAYADRESRIDVYRRLLDRLEGVGEVEHGGVALLAPLSDARINYEIAIDGQPVAPPGEAPDADLQLASGDYFEAMGIPLLAGRLFDDADPDGPPVALVSASLAEHLWGDLPAVGRQIGWVVDRAEGPRWFEVVGVVGDVRQQSVANAPNGTLILDYMSRPQFDATVAVRVRGDGSETARVLREEVPALGAGIPEPEITTLRTSRADDVAPARFMALLLIVFSSLAVLLAAVGTYASMAYAMARRRSEMGLRLAMGAAPRRLVHQVLVQGMAPVVAGAAIGLVVTLAAAGVLGGLLFGVAARDPLTLALSVAALGAVGFMACLVPAVRTARIDPVESLRET